MHYIKLILTIFVLKIRTLHLRENPQKHKNISF